MIGMRFRSLWGRELSDRFVLWKPFTLVLRFNLFSQYVQCIRRWSFLQKRGNVPSKPDVSTGGTTQGKATQLATSKSPMVIIHEQPQSEDQGEDLEMQPRK